MMPNIFYKIFYTKDEMFFKRKFFELLLSEFIYSILEGEK